MRFIKFIAFTIFTVLVGCSKNTDKEGIRTRGPHPGLEKEAYRIRGLLPVMLPGKIRNENVAVSYTVPIIFKL